MTGCHSDAEVPEETKAPSQIRADAQVEAPVEEAVPSAPAEPEAEPPAEIPSLALPHVDAETGLEISAFFESSIMNPDAELAMADAVASLEVTNGSEQLLRRADLEVTTTEGSTYTFRIQDLPAGEKAWVFDTENRSGIGDGSIEAIVCTGFELRQPDQGLLDAVTMETEGLTVTVTNIGTQPLENLELVCRCSIADLYFGGISYAYPILSLMPGEQTQIDAVDCSLGMAVAVDLRAAEE